LFFSPFVPLLFMGQEYAETAEFLYFTDHGDPTLIRAVREGRQKEYEAFSAGVEFLDPHDETAFQRSKLNWTLRQTAPHCGLLAWYRDWLAVRKRHAALSNCRKSMVRAKCDPEAGWLVVERGDLSGSRALLACNFAKESRPIPISFRGAEWSLCLWSGANTYGPPSVDPPPKIVSHRQSTVILAATSAALYVALPGDRRARGEPPCD
jgi:maltooligosyltrehalose trehalohydrolase